MPADFTPSLLPFSGQGPFRYWCQTVLPLVYDDSLSYYELLNKVVDYLNKALADVANLGTNVDSLENAYAQLQNYVNEYFDNLDLQSEINEKLDNMAESGELAELVSPIVSVEVAQWLQEHITPTSPAVDKSLTVDGAAADSAVVGNKVEEVESNIASTQKDIDDLISLNSFDIFQHIAEGTRTDKGVTYVSDGKGKYTINGTASGSSFCNICDFNLPDRCKTDVDYWLVFDRGNSALKLRFYCYDVDGNTMQGYPKEYTVSQYVTIPTGTKRLLARLQVDSGVSVNNVVVEPKLLTAQSNNYLQHKVYNVESNIASTQKDIDDLISLNSFDIFQHIAEGTRTDKGVTYVSDGKGKYTINGTASGSSFCNICDFNLPDRCKTDVDYWLVFDRGNSALKLRFYCYDVDGNTMQGYPKEYTVSQYVTIPTGTKRLLARLQVDSGVSVNNVVVEPKLLTAQSNNYLQHKVYNNEIGLLDLLDYNNRNVLPYVGVSKFSYAGVTFYTDGYGNYTLSGTATGAVTWDIVTNTMPDGIEAGGTYKLIFETDSAVKFRVYCYDENSATLPGYPKDYGASTLIKIPSGTNKLTIKFYIASGSVLNNTTISPKIVNNYLERKVDNNEIGLLDLVDYNSRNVLPYLPESELGSFYGVRIYSDGLGNYTLNGTATNNAFCNIVTSTMPDGIEPGGTYKLIFETDSGVKIRVYCYDENGRILPGYPSDYGSTKVIKIPIEANNMIIRIQIPSGAVLNNTTISPKIINSPTNSELDARLTNLEMATSKVSKPIFYISEGELHLVRCEWDDNFDVIVAFQYPGSYNRNFNFADVKVIPKATEFNDTVTAYNNAGTYKKANDDVSPLRLNGYFIGANHGNPNFTKVDTNGHDKTEADIGSRWSNGTNVFTLVVVDGNSLIFGWLNSQNELEPIISSTAFALTHVSGATHSSSISATSSTSYQLRNACNNITVKVLNENNTPITSGETAEKIVVVEEYDIIDQSKILAYLQNKVGRCTNSSYYSNNIATLMGHVSNKRTFFRNGSVIEALGFQAKENLTFNYWYGLQSQNFTDDDFVDNRVKVYVPNSTAKNIVPLTTTSYLDISKDNGTIAPYRYYQLRTDYTKAFFIHYIQVGAASNENRIELSVAGAVSITNGARFKLYGRMDQTEREMNNGDIVQYMTVRGPMKTSANQTVIAWWWEGDTIILCLDFHQSFTGPVKLPAYMVGKKVTVVDDGGLEVDNFVGSLGLNVSSNNYSYAVMKLTD